MKKDVKKRKLELTTLTVHTLQQVGAALGPVSTKPCSDGTCFIWHTVCQ